MLPPRRLILAASDPRLTQAVQLQLQRSLQITCPVVRFDEVANLLAPETDGDILLLASEPGDVPIVEAVVREAKVQQSPASFAILESEAVAAQKPFEHLDPHLCGRWIWPHQTRDLTIWARRSLSPGNRFAAWPVPRVHPWRRK